MIKNKYCAYRVWASGDTEDCGKPAVIICDTKPLCQYHANETFVSLKQSIISDIDLILSKVSKFLELSERTYCNPILSLLKAISTRVFEQKPIDKLTAPEPALKEDKEYWMNRAKEAEDKLTKLSNQGINASKRKCFFCKKNDAIIQDMCLGCSQELNSKLSQ